MSLASSSSSSRRNPGEPYTVELLSEKLVDASGKNAVDLYCPLGGCRCLLLRKGSAKLVERNGDALLHPSAKPINAQSDEFPLQSSSSDASISARQSAWLVTSPLTFENIGFTKGVLSNTSKSIESLPEGASIRYLACADCDCGPLGWHVEHKGSDLAKDVDMEINEKGQPDEKRNIGPIREFLLAIERCRYKLE